MQELFKKIFNKDLDNEDMPRFLEGVTRQYPYFTAAHFFLLSKTAASETSFSGIAAKTALHFDNPFLLNYRLEELRVGKVVKEVEKVETVYEVEIVDEVEKVEEVTNVESVEGVDEIEKVEEVMNVESVDKVERVEEVDKIPEPEIVETEVKPKEEMLFEPLFATDYFASQGIKLSEEVQPADKLGKQLKSFTDWLKSMKKVHDQKLPPGNEQIDLAVQTLAEKSNLEDDVLTESMAEAYLQQNKPKKAVEIFQKLSLLNPAKSAYFAAKIDEISGK